MRLARLPSSLFARLTRLVALVLVHRGWRQCLGSARRTRPVLQRRRQGDDGFLHRSQCQCHRLRARGPARRQDRRSGQRVALAAIGPWQGSEFALARYNADGSLDTSFSGDGKVTTGYLRRPGLCLRRRRAGRRQDRRGGFGQHQAAELLHALHRWCATTPTAASTPASAAAGIVSTDFFGTENVATSVAIQPDGRIVVAGSAHDGIAQPLRAGALQQPTAASTRASAPAAR